MPQQKPVPWRQVIPAAENHGFGRGKHVPSMDGLSRPESGDVTPQGRSNGTTPAYGRQALARGAPSADAGWGLKRGELILAKGFVKWFDTKKGYGFIEQPGGDDIFVHYTGIAGDGFRSLRAGEEVEFEVSQGPKGAQATKVVRAS